MKCCDARREMALHLGHDGNDAALWEEVRRHVCACADCRAHYGQLKTALAVLEQAEGPSTYATRGSLWDQLEPRLDLPARSRSSNPRRWLPVVSVAAACLLLVVVWTGGRDEPGHRPGGPSIGRQFSPFSELPHRERHPSREAREADEKALRSAPEQPADGHL